MSTTKVWDPVVRISHWTLVACVIGNYALNEAGESLHQWMGYAAVVAVMLRIVWGFVGTQHARFSDFFPTPARLSPYMRALLRGNEPRSVGHNPAGALMMLVLMALIVALGCTGYLMETDAFWGNEGMQNLHSILANTLITLVCVHAAAAVVESMRHRENLIWSMVTGKKRTDA